MCERKLKMCLYIDKTKTNKAKKNKTGKVVRWKVVTRSYFGVVIDFLHSVMKVFTWKIGWNQSDRKNNYLSADESDIRIINHGIHVFTTRKIARSWCGHDGVRGDRIVKIICYNKDLVAVGNQHDEVYMKVFLPKDEHDSAVKRKGIERR